MSYSRYSHTVVVGFDVDGEEDDLDPVTAGDPDHPLAVKIVLVRLRVLRRGEFAGRGR